MANTEIPDSVSQYLERFPNHRKSIQWLIVPPTIEEACELFPELGRSSLTESDGLIQDGITRIAFYVCLREAGESHAISEMLAAQQTARAMTDDVFFGGMPMLGDSQRNDRHLNSLVAAAKRNGYTPSPHDVYLPGLARWRGDPEAFVNRTRGRAHIKAVCEQRGWECDGAVTVAGRGPESDPLAKENCVSLAEDLIQDTAREKLKSDPSLRKLDRRELREKIVAEHGQH